MGFVRSDNLQRSPRQSPRSALGARCGTGGFTILELLVVIAIIVLLIGLLMVGLSAAARSAQMANTRVLMTEMVKAITRFNEDTGYYPPILGPRGIPGVSPPYAGAGSGSPATLPGYCRDLFPSPNATTLAGDVQLWNSFTSPAEYLLGGTDRSADGYGVILTASMVTAGGTPLPGARETPRNGVRHPGRDGVWGALLAPAPVSATGYPAPCTGCFGRRNLPADNLDSPASPTAASGIRDMPRYQNARGKQLGPYMDLKDDKMVRGITGLDAAGEPVLVSADEVPNFDVLPKCIVDYWGRPIRYYRKPYSGGEPGIPAVGLFDVGDYFALRPGRFSAGDDVNGSLADGATDLSTSRGLRAAEFALLSYGPDRSWDRTRRVDVAGYNADNVVEVGP
ncbi:MAG: type II secretion system protein [Phycisphaerales bacterium]|nr:type II secretion system protein [Phycisphaerales bacterium]